jgi:hypothetical protein
MSNDLDERIRAFWQWFGEIAEELYDEFDPHLPLFHQMVGQIHKVDPRLVIDVSTPERGIRELVISADGKRGAFPVVMAMVEVAPRLKHFRVAGFRPRREGHLNIIVDGLLIETTNMFYLIKQGGEKVDVQVWMIESEGLTEQHHIAAEVVLINLLGEYVYVTRVRRVSVHLVDQEREYPDLKPMVHVGKAFDDLFGEN